MSIDVLLVNFGNKSKHCMSRNVFMKYFKACSNLWKFAVK